MRGRSPQTLYHLRIERTVRGKLKGVSGGKNDGPYPKLGAFFRFARRCYRQLPDSWYRSKTTPCLDGADGLFRGRRQLRHKNFVYAPFVHIQYLDP